MSEWILLLLIIIPAVAALPIFIIPKNNQWLKESLSFLTVTINLILIFLLMGKELIINLPWIKISNFTIGFSLKLFHFSWFITASAAVFAFLIILYSITFMRKKNDLKLFYAFVLLTLAMVNGAVLANDLILMLFFWEGMLITIFALIMSGGKSSIATAVKSFVLVGVADLCMILGIALAGYLAGSFRMDEIHLSMNFWGVFAFVLLMIGAISKAGSMPFHSWIPDAAIDAPLPFMAFLPAALEKLLGIYFLTRISMDFFKLEVHSTMSYLLMSIGAVTILGAVMMALIQKNFKRLLSYHAISQVGYMILGIGTAIPVGIVGGLFHMINHTIYKSCLFLTGGAVEKQTGTTDLTELGGVGKLMPVTFTCFIISALSISGVPPFNGFFSKELIYDGALEGGMIFYIAAALGSFLTAASFLKLGHAAFLGKKGKSVGNIKEVPLTMTIPMIILAALCVLFGVYNPLPLEKMIQPILGAQLGEHNFAGLPHNWIMVGITIVVLGIALLNHLFGVKRTKSGVGALDHIHHAPVLSTIYNWAEKRYFDPYDVGLKITHFFSIILNWIDRAIDWFYNIVVTSATNALSYIVRKAHTGNHVMYLIWSLTGLIVIAVMLFNF